MSTKGNQNVAPGIKQVNFNDNKRQTDNPDRRTQSQKRKYEPDRVETCMKKRCVASPNSSFDFQAEVMRSSTPDPDIGSQTDRHTRPRKGKYSDFGSTNPLIE